MGRASRVKGHNFEREIARQLREKLGEPFKRGLQTREGGEVPDVFSHTLPYWFECKKGKSIAYLPALKQAEKAIKEAHDPHGPTLPVAVLGLDNEQPLALLRWELFKEILADAVEWRRHREGVTSSSQ